LTVFSPRHIFIENEAKDLPLTRQILERCPHASFECIHNVKEFIFQHQAETPDSAHTKDTLLICRNKGRFLEPCPGTKNYLCCGYLILNTGTGCPLNCSYCVLQAYLNNPFITVYANLHDLWQELESSALLQQVKAMRIGTGEYGDSLALEHLTGLAAPLAAFFKKHAGPTLELKTKTAAIEPLIGLDHGGSFIVSWSLNTEEIAQHEEHGAAPVAARIQAAQRIAEEGYKIGFHFDPLIIYPGWERGYYAVVDLISKHIPPASIAWISLGALRFMPALKTINHNSSVRSSIFAEEFIPGLDGKMRYFQELRTALFKRLAAWLRQYAPDICIYLCMESPLVWKRALGCAPSSAASLKRMLDEQCR
jgi:spore photoproduct lyase